MKDEAKDTTTAGSDRILMQGSDGRAGPSREVSECDHRPSGAGCAGRMNEELEWARRHVPEEPVPVRSVFRKTGLHGTSRARTPGEKNRRRKKIIDESQKPGEEPVSRQVIAACRDLLDTLIGKQDLLYEEMLLHVADLQRQINALEQKLREGLGNDRAGTPHSPAGQERS
jgi:hypothetical protein